MCKIDGLAVELVVRRYLKLRHNPRTGPDNPRQGTPDTYGSYGRPTTSESRYASSTTAGAADLSQLHAEIEAQRGDIDRIDSEGYKVVTAFNGAVTRVEAGLSRMEAALADLRREIEGSQEDTASLKSEIRDVKRQAQAQAEEARTTTDRLEDRLQSANTSIEGLRRDLGELTANFDTDLGTLKAGLRQNTKDIAELKSFTLLPRDHAEDMAAVRGEIAQLRKQMDYNNRSPPAGPFPLREIDILTSNISKIGNRANQVEGLQMEFEILKGRVERVEAAAQAQLSSQAHQLTVPTAMGISIYDRHEDHDVFLEETYPRRRKRTPLEQKLSSPITRQQRIAASPDVTNSLSSLLQHQIESRAEKDARVEPTERTGRPPKRKSVGG
jgi:archaellum component FlaC